MNKYPNFHPFLAYSASAGSGKTFALSVRYVSLLFMGEMPSSILAATFTNKAAGEMSLRLREHSRELEQNSADPRFSMFVAALDSLNILTIDGFCSKLVKEGFFSEVHSQFEIIDSFAYKKKIENLFARWNDQYSGERKYTYNSK